MAARRQFRGLRIEAQLPRNVREMVALPHEQAVQPHVLHVEGVRRLVERGLVVHGRVVHGGLVHGGELGVHEVPVAHRRRPVLQETVAVAIAGLEPPVEGPAQDRVGPPQQPSVGVAPVDFPQGVGAEGRMLDTAALSGLAAQVAREALGL